MSNRIFDFCSNSRVIAELPPEDAQVTSMNGWDFSAKPKTPYRRTFKGTLFGLKWFLSSTYSYDVELVTGNTFLETTGWTTSGGAAINTVTGLATLSGTAGSFVRNTATSGLTNGDTVALTVDVESLGASGTTTVTLGYSGNTTLYTSQTLVKGVNQFIVPIASTQANFTLSINNPNTATYGAVIRSVSVRKVTASTYGALDLGSDSEINVGRLLAFYRDHRTWDSFLINHEYLGQIRVRFNKPIQIPPGNGDSGGLCDPIEIELIEHSPGY